MSRILLILALFFLCLTCTLTFWLGWVLDFEFHAIRIDHLVNPLEHSARHASPRFRASISRTAFIGVIPFTFFLFASLPVLSDIYNYDPLTRATLSLCLGTLAFLLTYASSALGATLHWHTRRGKLEPKDLETYLPLFLSTEAEVSDWLHTYAPNLWTSFHLCDCLFHITKLYQIRDNARAELCDLVQELPKVGNTTSDLVARALADNATYDYDLIITGGLAELTAPLRDLERQISEHELTLTDCEKMLQFYREVTALPCHFYADHCKLSPAYLTRSATDPSPSQDLPF